MSEPQPPNRYDKLERVSRNAIEVTLEEVARDAEGLIASNASIVEILDYVVMLDKVVQRLHDAECLVSKVRRSVCREFVRAFEDLPEQP